MGDLKVEPLRAAMWSSFRVPARRRDTERLKLQAQSFSMVLAASPEEVINQVQASILRWAAFTCACFALCNEVVDRQIFGFVDWLRCEFELRPANSKDKVEGLGFHYLKKPELPGLIRALGQSSQGEFLW